MASGEQDYNAYQLQQQQLQEQQQQQLSQVPLHATKSEHAHGQIDTESYANPVTVDHSARHHFVHQDQTDDGDASLAGMDRTTGASLDEPAVAVTLPTCVANADAAVASYALHHESVGDRKTSSQQEEPDESNVVDEYFITTTIQEEQQRHLSEPNIGTPGNERKSRVASSDVAEAIEWEDPHGQQVDAGQRVQHPQEKSHEDLEAGTPVKKRKHSLKFNGDSNME